MEKCGEVSKKDIYWLGIQCMLAIVIAILLSHTVLSQYFLIPKGETVIEVIDTATKNRSSGGTDVRIKNIKVDTKEIPFNEMRQNGNWIFKDDVLMIVNPQMQASLQYSVSYAEKLDIEFQKHEGSGIVLVKINGKKADTIDLYSTDWDEYHYQKKLGEVSISEHWELFLILVLSIVFMIISMVHVIDIVKERKAAKIFLKYMILIYVVIILGCQLYSESIKAVELFYLFLFGIIVSFRISKKVKKEDAIVVKYVSRISVISATAVLMYYIIERINGNVYSISILYAIGNIGIYLLIIIIIFMLFRRLWISVITAVSIAYIFALVNRFVLLFRGTPIVPGDFLIINTAKNVFKNYQYRFEWNMFFCLMLVLVWCGVVIYVLDVKKETKKEALNWTLPAVLLISLIIGSDFYKPRLDLWDLKSNLRTYGIGISLVSGIRAMNFPSPDEYSYDKIEAYADEYSIPSQEKNISPNVIAIMNESFSDLSIISDVLDSDTYMPYYNSLYDNTVKGYAAVSTIGGGTSNTEYEFLTGNSMAFVPGTVPYQQFIIKTAYSMPRILKERGYSTIAIHPYDKSGYSRMKVYPNLGFDDFLDIKSFNKAELVRDRYISDKDSYQKVIDVFEKNSNNQQPMFIFNVTMQNHSDYLTGYYGNDTVKVPEHQGEFLDAEEYLTLIKKSDEAFPILIDYFSKIESPTVIIMFGDHQPRIDDKFYEMLKGKMLNNFSLEETQQLYTVPFFIWANYDIEEQKDVFTSANYLSGMLFKIAGIQTVPYQNYLLQLQKEIPAMNINGYLSIDGQWHFYSEETRYSPYLQKYWEIQYNNMFAKKKCKQMFLDIKN